MMLFRQDIQVAATVYVTAATVEEAKQKIAAMKHDTLELRENRESDLPIYGGTFHADMPEVSLSPAMTVHGVWPGDDDEPELIEEELLGDDEEADQ